MKTNLSSSVPSQLETDCLVVVALDHSEQNKAEKGSGEKDTPVPSVACPDAAVREAAKDVIASGELTAKPFETTLLHNPAGLKAKRLLLVGGGKAKSFSSSELRKLAGAAVRTLKSKSIKSFAFVAPALRSGADEGVKAIVEGAFVGNFEPDYYKSDRKEQKIDELVVVAAKGNDKSLKAAIEQGRIIGEAQNFTRDLVNEPGNRMTPT